MQRKNNTLNFFDNYNTLNLKMAFLIDNFFYRCNMYKRGKKISNKCQRNLSIIIYESGIEFTQKSVIGCGRNMVPPKTIFFKI